MAPEKGIMKAKDSEDMKKGKEKIQIKRLPRWLVGVFVYLASIVAIILVLFGTFSVVFADQIYPRVSIADIPVGGLTQDQAKARLEERLAGEALTPVILTSESGKSFTIKPDQVAASYNIDESVKAAYAIGRTGDWLTNITQKITTPLFGYDLAARLSLNEEQFTSVLNQIVSEVEVPVKDATLEVKNGEASIKPAQIGQTVETAKLKEQVLEHFGKAETDPIDLVLKKKEPQFNEEDLADALKQAQAILAHPFTLTSPQESFTATPAIIGTWLQTKTTKGLIKEKVEIDLKQEKIDQYIASLAEKLDKEPINARLAVSNGQVTITQSSQDGVKLKRDKAKTDLIQLLTIRKDSLGQEAANGSPSPQASSTSQTIASLLPQSTPASIPTPSASPALSLSPSPAVTLNQITLELEVKKPDITNENINNLGIKERIAISVTDFKGSPANRQENIRVGTRLFNGIILKPGDEFSAVKSLGRIDESSGFKPELVIKQDQLIPEVGGGLCQVSTTLFRAAMNAGLDILERKNHRFRVSYYEARPSNPDPEDYVTNAAKTLVGMDATIYDPSPDFKFKNDMAHHILIQGRVEGTRLTFELYGTKDGRKTTIDGPHITSTTPAPTEIQYIDDPTLPAGQTKLKEKPVAGARTTLTYMVEKDGKTLHKDTFNSIYTAWQAKYYRGTGPAASPSPATTVDPAATPATSPVASPSPEAAPSPSPST